MVVCRMALVMGLCLSTACEGGSGEESPTDTSPRDAGSAEQTRDLPADGAVSDLAGEEDASSDAAAETPPGPRVRTPCFDGEPVDTGMDPPPETCVELFEAEPDMESGCYVMSDALGGTEPGYCWHKRLLLLLVNNDTEGGFHDDDVDQDGVLDRGENAGANWPADPFDSPESVAERLRVEIRDWFADVSYGALYMEVAEVYWEPSTADAPSRWFRLLRERPGFANEDLFSRVCALRGGFTLDDWRSFASVVTVISQGTVTSGSQGRKEFLPVGDDCSGREELWRNYVVMKNFRRLSSLGTFLHEISHGLARDPNREPSLGHSESLHPETGVASEYGDITDVMGGSQNRGHFSLPQKLFLRLLAETEVEVVRSDTEIHETRIYPLESTALANKGVIVPVAEGRTYYVEVRRPIGNDARIARIFHAGALVKRANDVPSANKSWIVDPTPETASDQGVDSVLLPHRTFVDAANDVTISVLSSEAGWTDVEVRRGEVSVAPPIVEDVEVLSAGGTTVFTASAVPGEGDIGPEELLYFWKLGGRGGLTLPEGFRTGVSIELQDAELPRRLWLVVSDRRGGETWFQVR